METVLDTYSPLAMETTLITTVEGKVKFYLLSPDLKRTLTSTSKAVPNHSPTKMNWKHITISYHHITSAKKDRISHFN